MVGCPVCVPDAVLVDSVVTEWDCVPLDDDVAVGWLAAPCGRAARISMDGCRVWSGEGGPLVVGGRLVGVVGVAGDVGLESVAARATAATDTVPNTLAMAAAQVSAEIRRCPRLRAATAVRSGFERWLAWRCAPSGGPSRRRILWVSAQMGHLPMLRSP